ncbi:Fanconi anemia group C protein-like [Porites lutea]|uniref:Fanconi anemia group C protein-like n=1 Tax=Porites lutea TaxID=51062 RepID=UPI003CC66C99
MMSVSEEDVQRWFDVVIQWGSADTSEKCRDTFECLDELHVFLKQLENALGGLIGNPKLILQKFPSLGKFLGQLFENSVILLSDDVFHSVIRCSLALANCSNSQGTIFSRKAKSWALTQLRRASTPTLKHSNLMEVGEYWGYSAEESTEMMVDKLVSSLCHDLKVMESFKWNDKERECYPLKKVSGSCLRELCEFCLPLLTLTQAKPLVEKILCCQKSLDLISSYQDNGFNITDSVPLMFLKAVASTKGLLLSYEARVALWKRYQPSFESEILDLIEMSTIQRPFISRIELKDAISSKELPRASVENRELFEVAMSLLSSFLVRSGGSTQVAKLVSVFGEMCVEQCKDGNQQSLLNLTDLFPCFCCSIVAKLALNPQGVTDEAYALSSLQSISMELEEIRQRLSNSESFLMWKTLWCFSSWEIYALHLSLVNSREEVLESCINILCWFHVPPLTDSHISVKAALKEILPPLRLLKSKSRLQFADLQYVLFTSPVLHASESTILLGRLLMVFLCDAIGGHLVFSHVVQMLTPGFSATKRLSFVLDCFENSSLVKNSRSARPAEQTEKTRESLGKEIVELLHDVKKELSWNNLPITGGKVTSPAESAKVDEKDNASKDLFCRTETLIANLQP